MRQEKKNGVNLNPQQEKYAYKTTSWRKNTPDSAFPRTLLNDYPLYLKGLGHFETCTLEVYNRTFQ